MRITTNKKTRPMSIKTLPLSPFLYLLVISFIFASSIAAAKNEASSDKTPKLSANAQKSINLPYQPFDIRKTNIKDTKFTISWRTLKSAKGFIMYGETPSCGQIAFDDRGKAVSKKIHYVTIRNLKPTTVYYYKIVSAGKIYQNNNRPFTVTTGPSIMATGSDVAYGRIYAKKNSPYKKGAVVYLTLCNKNGTGSTGISSPVSVLTDKNGYWSYELKNFREENLNNLFTYSEAGDSLKIEVQVEELPNGILLEVDTKNDSPVKNISIR